MKIGGVDGIIVENYGDKPHKPRVTDPETIVAVAIIIREIVKNYINSRWSKSA